MNSPQNISHVKSKKSQGNKSLKYMKYAKRSFLLLLLSLVALALTACPGGTTPVADDFSLSATAVSIKVAESGTSTITVTKIGSFADLVNLSVSGLPLGASSSFSNAATNTTSTLNIQLDNTATAGSHQITVVGVAGAKNHATQFMLTIIKKTDTADFSLTATDTKITTGESGASTITISRTGGLTAKVDLTVSGLPTGVISKLTASSADKTSTLNLTVDKTAKEGEYTITVSGKVGTNTHTAQFKLTLEKKAAVDFSLAATNTNVILGKSASSTISIARVGGFADLVNLSVSGLPVGVTPQFTPVAANAASSLNLTVAKTTKLGKYTITVTGKSGAKTHTVQFELVIENIADNGSFTLSATTLKLGSLAATSNAITTAQITIEPRRMQGKVDISVQRKNSFKGTIDLTIEGLPNGVLADFDTNQLTGNKTFLNIGPELLLPAGTYPLAIVAKSGSKTAIAQFDLVIVAGVISSDPEDGDKGVFESATIRIEFSVAMDKKSTEAAFTSDFGQVEFFWDADEYLIVTPKTPLQYSDNETPKFYNFSISKDAKDTKGNNLEKEYKVKFSTYRTVYKEYISEASVDGEAWSDSTSSTHDTWFTVGDVVNNAYVRGFLSFDFSSKPAAVIEIKKAEVVATQFRVEGSPYDDLDDGTKNLRIYHVYYDSLDASDFDAVPLDATSMEFSSSPDLESKTATITNWMQADYNEQGTQGHKAQFRLQFAENTDGNNDHDYVQFYSGDEADNAKRPVLKVWYWVE